jgi:hypothetical protein
MAAKKHWQSSSAENGLGFEKSNPCKQIEPLAVGLKNTQVVGTRLALCETEIVETERCAVGDRFWLSSEAL